jgi:hypothetical protein
MTLRRKLLYSLPVALLAVHAWVYAQNSAIFPSRTVTAADLFVASNYASTTLVTGINSSATSATVGSGSGFVVNQLVSIDNEILVVCGVAGNTLTFGRASCGNVDGRGFDGSSAVSHLAGRLVQGRVVAWLHNQLAAEVIAIEGLLPNTLKCTDTSDKASALAALIAGGANEIRVIGTCRFTTDIGTIPNTGGSTPTQTSLHIFGTGSSANGYWGILPSAPSVLDLRYNASVGIIDTRGAGVLEIDHLNIKYNGTGCPVFIHDTNTTIRVHDNAFEGNASQTSACNDVFELGGPSSTTVGSASTSPFQGYGTVIERNFFSQIRRELYCRTFCNNVQFVNNTGSNSSGSNLTAAISAATNANPAVLTLSETFAGFGVVAGTVIPLNISGFTGNWTPANGQKSCVLVSSTTCSLTGVNSTGYGAMAGSPVYLNGAAIEIDGGGSTSGANVITGNLIEATYYPYAMKVAKSVQQTISGNGVWDNVSTLMIAAYRFESTATQILVEHGYFNYQSLGQIDNSTYGNAFVTSGQNQMSKWPSPWLWANNVYTQNSQVTGRSMVNCDASGNCFFSQIEHGGDTTGFYRGTGCAIASAGTLTCSATTEIAYLRDAGSGDTILNASFNRDGYIDTSRDLKLRPGSGTLFLGTAGVSVQGVYVQLGNAAYAGLGSVSNGQMIYCTDCKNVPDDSATAGAVCVSGGNGAVARREHGHWACN